jgi:hypothetical protein
MEQISPLHQALPGLAKDERSFGAKKELVLFSHLPVNTSPVWQFSSQGQ